MTRHLEIEPFSRSGLIEAFKTAWAHEVMVGDWLAVDFRTLRPLETLAHVGRRLSGRSLTRPMPRWTTLVGPYFLTDVVVLGFRATGTTIEVAVDRRRIDVAGDVPCRMFVARGTPFDAIVRAHRRGHMAVKLEVFGYEVPYTLREVVIRELAA